MNTLLSNLHLIILIHTSGTLHLQYTLPGTLFLSPHMAGPFWHADLSTCVQHPQRKLKMYVFFKSFVIRWYCLIYLFIVYLPALHSRKEREAKLAWATTESPVLRAAPGTKSKVCKYWAQARSLEQGPHECGWTYGSRALGTKSGNKAIACGI